MGRIFGLIKFSQGKGNKEVMKKVLPKINWWLNRKSIKFVKVMTVSTREIEQRFVDKKEYEELKKEIMNEKNKVVLIGLYGATEKKAASHTNIVSDSLLFTQDGLQYAPKFENMIEKLISQTRSPYELLDSLNIIDSTFSLLALLPNGAILAKRDKFGVKPLWYGIGDETYLVFSSERKMLFDIVSKDKIIPLAPRDALLVENSKLKVIKECTSVSFEYPTNDISEREFFEAIHERLVSALKKRTPKGQKVAVLFSGGVDSTVLAKLLLDLNVDVVGVTIGFEKAKDLEMSIKAADMINLPLEYKVVTLKDLENIGKKVVFATEEYNPIRVAVGMTLYMANNLAYEKGRIHIFSGTGSEEIFAGYQKYLELINLGIEYVHYATLDGLRNVWIRDLYRDDTIAFYSDVIGLLPYLDYELVNLSMKVNPKYKVRKDEKKIIFREYAEWLGVPKEIAWRPKLAAQYGSGITQNLRKVIRTKGYQHIIDWLYDVYVEHFSNDGEKNG